MRKQGITPKYKHGHSYNPKRTVRTPATNIVLPSTLHSVVHKIDVIYSYVFNMEPRMAQVHNRNHPQNVKSLELL